MSGGWGSPPLTLRVQDRRSIVVVDASGVVDFTTAPLLRAVLAELVEDDRSVVLDLAEVTLLDGHSVGMLVASARAASRRGTTLRIRRASGRVLRVLEIVGVTKLLDETAGTADLPDEPVEQTQRGRQPATDRTVEVLLGARQQHAEDEAQREALRLLAIASAQGLAAGLARRYRGRGEPLEDLTQVATLGLIKAVDGFDPAYGAAFSSYAVPTIIGELRRYFRDKGWQIRVPRWIQEIGLEVAEAGEVLAQRLGRSPTIRELATYLGATEEQVLETIDAMHAYRPASLSAPANGSGDSDTDLELADRIGAFDRGLDLVDDRESLRPLLAALPARQRRIIAMRFYGNMTQAQIATRIGISQMHVSRLLSDALDRLRQGLVRE
jgi:RNA polymerase sigma-B factor